MDGPVAEERFGCVGAAVEVVDDARVATCIVAGMVAVVAIVSVDVAAGGTSVHPLRG